MTEAVEEILKFPCEIKVKAMGLACENFELTVFELVRCHAPETCAEAVSSRPSNSGKYLSVSVIVQASSREQMDRIYQALSDHDQVLLAL